MMKRKTVIVVLAIFLCRAVTGSASIVSDYPGLEPLVDLFGEEGLSVLDLVGFKAADRAMKDPPFSKGGMNATDLRDFGTHKWWWVRLKMDLWMMDYLDRPETLVSTLKKFSADSPAEIEKLKSAGVNPLVELGIMPGKTEAEKTPSVPRLVMIAAMAIAGALLYAARRRKAS